MTAAGLPSESSSGATLSIGSVLDALRAEFPEITISKIRFLESEGLISPARTPSGYRQFSHADVARLRFVLSAQRDHYLPLKVIRAKLAEFDASPTDGGPVLTAVEASPSAPPSPSSPSTPPGGGGGGGGGSGPGGDPPRGRTLSTVVTPVTPGPGDDDDPDGLPGSGHPGVDRASLLAEDGVDEALVTALEHHGVLRADASGRYEPEAPAVARTAAALAALGVEPRLLRGLRAGAEREVGLLTQLVTPVARGRAPDSARRAEQLCGDLATLSGRMHALLVGAGLRGGLRR